MPFSKGHKKIGGKKKGTKNKATLEKEQVLAEIQQRIMRKASGLVDAQSSLANGQQFLYKIEKTKVVGSKGGVTYRPEKPKLVTSQWELEAYLDGLVEGDDMNEPGDTYYFLTTKEPSNMAIDSMLDRTFGQSVKTTVLTGKDGKDLIPSLSPAMEQYAKMMLDGQKRINT